MAAYQEKNRVRYIEPTGINDSGTNGYQSPLEDLCVSVDLEIVYSTRKACGLGEENGEKHSVVYSSGNGTIVFNGGTNGFLTANYTDITAEKPWENTKECLGIKSIDISYNSLLYPQVVVKFTDIRGASLINSQELKSNYDVGEGSFYSLLYSTPSPLYKLTVKGFYGNPVVYNLVVNNTKLVFDASTGNFDVEVNFIGYMYGVYSDMPMTYLAVAPYILNSGVDYWEKETDENGRFRYRNGGGDTKMLTFPELRYQIAMAIQSEPYITVEDDHKGTIANYDNKIALLQKLYDEFPFPCTDLGERWEEPESAKMAYSVRDRDDVLDIVAKRVDDFVKDLESYNSSYPDDKLNGFGFVSLYKDGKNLHKYTFRRIKEKTFEVHKPDSYYQSVKDAIDRREFEKNNANISEYYVYVADKGNLQPFNGGKGIYEKQKKVENDKKKADSEYEKAKNQAIVNALGFPPTIRNLYQMAFAHFETFIHVFYECTKSINAQLSSNDEVRKASHYSISKDMTDCFTDELPPFPAFYTQRTDGDSTKKEEIWAGNLTNGSDLVEVRLVEAMISASKFYTDAEGVVNNKIEELKDDITDEDISKTLDEIYEESEGNNSFDSDDLRLSIYMNLKQLYERWFCLSDRNRWRVSPYDANTDENDGYKESDFSNFIYIDSFYHYIGDRLMVNVEAASDLMGRCMPTGDTDGDGNFSLFGYLSEIAQKNGGNLMALPVPFGGKDDEAMTSMFTAVPYMRKGLKVKDTSTYVFLYPYQMSQYLDGMGQYENDTFWLTNGKGDLSDDAMSPSLMDEDGGYVGAFGVAYARQNQAFFKNLTLNTSNPGVTEASIASTMNIASAAAQNPRATALFGQDIYRNYSNYSFEASMEMMGNAQVMPMMYFELNGVPMWRGTYMIKSVSHSIVPGNMTTTFSGYRMNKNAIPMAASDLVALAETAWMTDDERANTDSQSVKRGDRPYMEVTISDKGADRMEECVEAVFDAWYEGAKYDKFNIKSNHQCSGGVYRIAQMYYLDKKTKDVVNTRAASAYKVGKLASNAPLVDSDLRKQLEGVGYQLAASAVIGKDEWGTDSASNSRILLKKLGRNINVGDIVGYFPIKDGQLYSSDGHWHAALYKGKPSDDFLNAKVEKDKHTIAKRKWVSDFRQNNAIVYSKDTLTKPDAWACYLFKC